MDAFILDALAEFSQETVATNVATNDTTNDTTNVATNEVDMYKTFLELQQVMNGGEEPSGLQKIAESAESLGSFVDGLVDSL